MSIFPTKILLTTDGSWDAGSAARMAIGLVESTNSELHIVHVGPSVPTPYYPYIPGEDPTRMKREGRRLLDEQVESVKAAGGSITRSHLRIGEAAEEVVALGEELGAGLIVVGRRGRGRLRRALMGSVSDSVVRHAHCPVLVVRGDENGELEVPPKRTLVATDGSEEAELALQTAVDLTNSMNSELHVVHVGHLLGFVGYAGVDVGPLPGAQDEFDRKARKVLQSQVESVRAAGGTVAQAHLRSGRPDEEILAVGEELGAGLIVVGSRGLGGVRRAVMGSVSDSVVRHAHCPVLVARRGEPDPLLTRSRKAETF